jgi:hypothetical protein
MQRLILLLPLLAGTFGLCRPDALAQTYYFTTIAGQAGVIGAADGTNSDAHFNFPAGLALGADGSLYVTDLLNSTIRKITPVGTNWVVTTMAGLAPSRGSANGTNSDARFDRPTGIAVDGAGIVYVADKYNDTIRKLIPEGTNWIVTTIAGSPGVQAGDDGLNGNAHFWGPADVALDRSNRLYVVDSSNFTIRGLVSEGTNWAVTTLAGTALLYGFDDGTNGNASFDYPYGARVDGSGTIYVADWGNQAIRQVTPIGKNWVTTTIAGYLGDIGTNDGPGNLAKFNSPTGIAVDSQTNIFVTDYGSHTIRKISRAGATWMVTTIGGAALQFGATDGTNTAARFYRPWGIAVDPSGNLFVADYRNQMIRMGTLLLPPRPALQVAISFNQLVLFWPASATNYQLEVALDLLPGSPWTPITNGIVIAAGSFTCTNPISGPSAFYRLRLK